MRTSLLVPEQYDPLLNLRETEKAIRLIKDFFQTNLSFELNLQRVTAPMFVKANTGINDDLNGVEKPISFNIKGICENENDLRCTPGSIPVRRDRLKCYCSHYVRNF